MAKQNVGKPSPFWNGNETYSSLGIDILIPYHFTINTNITNKKLTIISYKANHRICLLKTKQEYQT